MFRMHLCEPAMEDLKGPDAWTFRDKPAAWQWSVLVAVSLTFVVVLELIHLPAALFLGPMLSAILLAAFFDGQVIVPRWPYLISQGLIGCLIVHGIGIGPGASHTIATQWPIFLASASTVILFSSVLGVLLARLRMLPGTTAVWGSAPGAATVMVLMADAFGGDVRLVAFMQFLRVIFVAVVASVVSRLWTGSHEAAAMASDWFPPFEWNAFAATITVATGGAIVGSRLKIPAGALLVPLVVGLALSVSGQVDLALPPWLMAVPYALLGWTIGMRFTRDIVHHAARMFPRIATSTIILIVLCGGLAALLHFALGTDALTAYLATSPGGADSVAIIAAGSKVDLPFVMAMQTSRFLLVMLVGPSIARAGARWAERRGIA